jgi:hypothetical protein
MPLQPIESSVESVERHVTQLEQLPARIGDLTSQFLQLRTEMRVEFSAVRREMADQGQSLGMRIDALGVQMRILHEDVIARFAQLQDGWSARPRRKPKRK